MGIKPTITAAAAAFLLGSTTTALAQGGDYSDEDLERYAQAASELEQISQAYNQELQQADPQQRQQIQAKMQQEMVEAVKEADLSVDKYNRISQQAKQDEALRQRVEEHIGDQR